jgi:hypothetical protein
MIEQKGDVPTEIETRCAKVMALYSKGNTQDEIAKELGVDQATVSRDLQEMRKQSRKEVTQQVTEEALFEFSRWTAGLDPVARVAWKVAENENSPPVSKMKALEFLKNCYDARLLMLIGSHPEGRKAQDHVVAMRLRTGAYEPDFYSRREGN